MIQRRAAIAATIVTALGAPLLVYLCRHPEVFIALFLLIGIFVMLILLWITLFKIGILVQQEVEKQSFKQEELDMYREEEQTCSDPFSEQYEH